MPKAYLLCRSPKFYQKSCFLSTQNNLFPEDVEGESETYIEPVKENYYLNFDKYSCHHDYKHNKKGKVFQKTFNYYFEPLDFYTYHNPKSNITLIQTKTDVAIDFISQLNESKNYKINPVKMDFHKMIPHIDEVGGAWIANLKRAHLRTAGLYGPHVNKSEEYKQAAKEGNVSSIQIKFVRMTNNNEYTILISNKGSVVLYDAFDTIEEELDLILEVYERLINPHVPV